MDVKTFVYQNFDSKDFYDMVDYETDYEGNGHSWFYNLRADYDTIKNMVLDSDSAKKDFAKKHIDEIVAYILKDMERYYHDNPDSMFGYKTKKNKKSSRKATCNKFVCPEKMF